METWLSWAVLALVALVMVVGLIGLVIPVLPGTVIIWLAALGWGLYNGFGTAGWIIFALMSVIMVLSTVLDNLVVGAKTLQGGAALSSVVLGILAGVLFTFLMPPLGGMLAAPLVMFLLEYRRSGSWEQAGESVKNMTIGMGLSWVGRLGMGVLMVVLWIFWVLSQVL